MQRQGGRNEVLRGRGERQEPTAGDKGQRGSRDRPQRASSLPELSLVKSGRLASLPDLHVSCQPISQVRTLQLRWSAPRPRPYSRAGIGSLSGLGSRAKDLSVASWGAWPVWMPQTGSVGRGQEPVKVHLVGGELAAGRRGREMAGPRGTVPGVAGAPGQRGVRDGCSTGTQAPTIPRRGHVLPQATLL